MDEPTCWKTDSRKRDCGAAAANKNTTRSLICEEQRLLCDVTPWAATLRTVRVHASSLMFDILLRESEEFTESSRRRLCGFFSKKKNNKNTKYSTICTSLHNHTSHLTLMWADNHYVQLVSFIQTILRGRPQFFSK